MLEQIRKYIQNSEIALGLGVVFILALIVIPLPGAALDVLIAVSLLSGMLVMMTALSSRSPADFTVFPTLLLLTTIYRLAVNISSTRMILTSGSGADSALIDAFGSFVIGGGGDMGSYVVGIILFLILTLVQILVITKGATRVSEVAARFALDSLPGKQLAIDSDLAAGHITDREARSRRESLQSEMNFYGAMDGASKFVQGDVRLGLIITAINIIGGLIIGVSIRGEPFGSAVEVYTRFTIGDGLVSQIPALLISSATGIIVSRSVSKESLPRELKQQLLGSPNTLYVVGGVLILSGFIPGFPLIAMSTIGGLLFWLGIRIEKSLNEVAEKEKLEETQQSEEKKPESHLQHLRSETLEVEIGYNLIPLVDPKAGGTLLDQISRLRRRFALELGLIVPPVRIRDNMHLQPGEYSIKLHGSPIAGSLLEPEKLMAIDTGRVQTPLEGLQEFREPTYGLKAYWIDPEQKSEAEASQYDVVDPSTVIATHLSDQIQLHSQEIMGRKEVKSILDTVREENSVVVDEVLVDKKVTIGQIQAVLQNLLRERVSIRNMVRILEAISNSADRTHRDPSLLTEAVRQMLHRQIVTDYTEDGRLRCVTIDPAIDRRLREGIHIDPEEGVTMSLKPDLQQALQQALADEYQKQRQTGVSNVLFLTSRATRAGIVYILERMIQRRDFAVLAQEEVPADVQVEIVGQVTLRKASAATAATEDQEE